MKVAFVCDWLTNYSGGEEVLKAMCESYPDAPIYTTIYNKKKVPQFNSKDVRVSFLNSLPKAKTKWQRYLSLMPYACEAFDMSEYDVVISSNHTGCSKGVITKPSCVHISYCHSPMRTVWDSYHEYLENSPFPGFLKKIIPFMLHKIRIWDFCAAGRVDYFISNSKFISSRIKKYYSRDSVVIYPPVDVDNFTYIEGTEVGDYYFIASRLTPNKNIEMAVRAFSGSGKRLVIAGRGPLLEHLKKIAGKEVEFLGYVGDDMLVDLMRKSRAFLYPQEEDFGITAVQSLLCGRPVVAYKSGGAVETIQENENGILFNVQDSESLMEAVNRCERNINNWDSALISKNAQRYSIERFKKEFVSFVESKIRNQSSR
jgi:glycosyltransferase involved in cell wall biosynthesis